VNTTVTDDMAADYREQLADELAAAGLLNDPAWRRAWQSVPRHLFAPRFAISAPGQPGPAAASWYDGSDPAERPRWLAAAYRNEALITRYADNGVAISSSTEPALMAHMLGLLDVHDGHKVLEIGTGTGYNAALLAHRLGPDNVTTIDVDPRLTQAAKEVLDDAGFPVTVLTGNGARRAAERAPFDRIIATCGVDRIPAAWIQQLAPGGLIVANVSRGLVALRRGNGDMVSGQFCGQAGFMALHTEGELPTSTSGRVFEVTGGVAERQYDADLPGSLDFTVASFLASLIAERSQLMFVHREDGTVVDYRWWHPASNSWVRVEPRSGGPARVHETGIRHLWAKIDPILADWDNAGRPGIDQFGLTITPQHYTLWVGSPSNGRSPAPSILTGALPLPFDGLDDHQSRPARACCSEAACCAEQTRALRRQNAHKHP